VWWHEGPHTAIHATAAFPSVCSDIWKMAAALAGLPEIKYYSFFVLLDKI
jgi:hypothetical protein